MQCIPTWHRRLSSRAKSHGFAGGLLQFNLETFNYVPIGFYLICNSVQLDDAVPIAFPEAGANAQSILTCDVVCSSMLQNLKSTSVRPLTFTPRSLHSLSKEIYLLARAGLLCISISLPVTLISIASNHSSMPKSKSKSTTSKIKSSQEGTPLGTTSSGKSRESKNPTEPSETLTWSAWIWDDNESLYYRGKLRSDSLYLSFTPVNPLILTQYDLETWEYEYAAGPPPVSNLLPTTPSNLPRYISSATPPIECTKEDLELKEVYAPLPSYADEAPYIEATCDDMTLPSAIEADPGVKPEGSLVRVGKKRW